MTERIIRTLTAGEVDLLVGWAAAEGWNPGEGDAEAFRAVDRGGFLGAFVDAEMAAGMSAVAYGESFGFIGLYICRPDMRGKGHGKAVWDASMARLGGRTVGLDGVPAQQANYRSMGFDAIYRTTRWSGSLAAKGGSAPSRAAVVAVSDDLVPLLAVYDAACFPAPRPAFLAGWLRPPRRALALVEDGAMRGYGAIRPCREGWKIGPLFADDADTAWSLLVALSGLTEGAGLHIDVPAAQTALIAQIEAAGLAPGFETARMYRGAAPVVDQAKVFGVTTLELG